MPRTGPSARILPLAVVFVLVLAGGLFDRGQIAPEPAPHDRFPPRLSRNAMPPAEGGSCAACHADIVALWSSSQHARANRLLADATFAPGTVKHADVTSKIDAGGRVSQTEGHRFDGQAVAVIGVEPLLQLLIAGDRGQWQAFDPAYDPKAREWFPIFNDGRRPEDWGHWSKRGMTWNSQCAWCHMTRFEKRYDAKTDSYDSTWLAMGIACTQCHGDLSAHAADPAVHPAQRLERRPAMDNCMSCHARREFLTPEAFRAGDAFHDHFRLELFDTPGVFHPDGQIQDEVFEAASFLSSKMHRVGVTCLDCHNPHSGKLLLPVSNNALCMSCHAAPGRLGATPVDATAHSRHAPDSPGNRCVECHMSHTTYMGRDPRRDHGFTVPDPLLSREIGAPDACTKCHSTQPADWAVEHAERWYGEKLAARRTRARARAIHQARGSGITDLSAYVAIARREDIPLWRATLVRLLRPHATQPIVERLLTESLVHEDPMVRAAAVHALSSHPRAANRLRDMTADPSRLVRLDAALALPSLDGLAEDLVRDINAYLAFNADQPSGALRMAQAALRAKDSDQVVFWGERMVALDGASEAHHLLGRLYHAVQRLPDAERALLEATRLDPRSSAAWYTLALLRGETGDTPGVRDALFEVVRIDPSFGRAWYNLGLACEQLGDTENALRALAQAEREMPDSPDPAYAIATIHARLQELPEAKEALRRALSRNPAHVLSLALLRRLQAE
jgi:predicted CXXCH cytochrome family protein